MEKRTPKQKKEVIFREFSSGGVVYKKEKERLLWLIAKTTHSKDYPKSIWRLPKGWLDDADEGTHPGKLASGEVKAKEEDIRKAALREVEEEGGVKAKIVKKLLTERYFYTNKEKQRIIKFVTFYLMEWVKDLPGGFGYETSEVGWFPCSAARKLLAHSGEKKILDEAQKIVDSGLQEDLI